MIFHHSMIQFIVSKTKSGKFIEDQVKNISKIIIQFSNELHQLNYQVCGTDVGYSSYPSSPP